VRTAGQLLQGSVTQDQVDDWAEKAGITVRARGPEGEEDMFLAEGRTLAPRAELQAKVARIQIHILPKVRAGEWTKGHFDVRRHVAEHAATELPPGESLPTWLDLRANEMRELNCRLEEVLAMSPFEPDKARAVEGHFFEINAEVDRKLHISAPEWVDYFNDNPSRFPMTLTFIRPEQFRDHLVAAIDSTIDQIAHIRARLR
jgi:hypothetical protein